MDVNVKHYGRVRSGEIVWGIPELLRQQLIELEGKEIVVIIKKKHEKVTLSQHGYYRGAILIACHKSNMFQSYDKKDDIHDEYFAPKFLSYVKAKEINGKMEEFTCMRHLSDLNKDEMSEFLERVLADCAVNGVSVDLPEMYYNKYYQK